jgi:hypothetical protein
MFILARLLPCEVEDKIDGPGEKMTQARQLSPNCCYGENTKLFAVAEMLQVPVHTCT